MNTLKANRKVITSPNSAEIKQAVKDLDNKTAEIESLKIRLLIAESVRSEIEQTIEYLGGKCITCGELGVTITYQEDDFTYCKHCL